MSTKIFRESHLTAVKRQIDCHRDGEFGENKACAHSAGHKCQRKKE